MRAGSKQTGRQTCRQAACRQTDRQTDRHQADRQTDRQAGSRQADRQAGRQRDRLETKMRSKIRLSLTHTCVVYQDYVVCVSPIIDPRAPIRDGGCSPNGNGGSSLPLLRYDVGACGGVMLDGG